LRKFPEAARKEAGVQLHKVQMGLDPSDWKPMATVGAGVREIRIRDEAGAFRVLYVANVGDAVDVLHAFQKKTQQTAKRHLDLATSRLRQI
jgi:phage-related protein